MRSVMSPHGPERLDRGEERNATRLPAATTERAIGGLTVPSGVSRVRLLGNVRWQSTNRNVL
jgi:hypothetical protein